MVHLGDISKLNGAEIEPVDVITFGSPCQDLSVAGKRAGIKHEANGDGKTTRSGLFMEAVRIIKEMREATNGKYPRFALWENVPGAFSSNNGADFRVVLEEIIKIVEPSAVMPDIPKSGWAYADWYVGDGWSVAYRVLDAQHWGVAQRRRRIYLVADFRGGSAGKILFEREGLRGNPEPSGTARQGNTTDTERNAGTDDSKRIHDSNSAYGVNESGDNITLSEELHACLTTGGGKPGQSYPCALVAENPLTEVKPPTFIIDSIGGRAEFAKESDVNGTLLAGSRGAVSYQRDIEHGLIPYDVSRNRETNISPTLDTTSAYPNKNQGGVAVVDRQHRARESSIGLNGGNVAPSLIARMSSAVGTTQDNLIVTERRETARHIVRRLVPTECARLQGFPDTWGHITEKDNLTDQEHKFWLEVRNTHAEINGRTTKDYSKEQILTWYNKLHTDSAEYKMWGNGIALPTALYVMQGIADALCNSTNEVSRNPAETLLPFVQNQQNTGRDNKIS